MHLRKRKNLIARCMEEAASLERHPDRNERKAFCRRKISKLAAKRKKRKKRG